MIDVSVVVPVYNVEKYIIKSVESILNQTHKNIEVILVDDGSTDASGSLCDLLKEQDQRITVIHKQNEGVGYARNTGMDVAKGEYLYFCDPDDFLDKDLIKDNLSLAKEHDADIVEFGYRNVYCDKDGEIQNIANDVLPGLTGAYDYREFCENFPGECKLGYLLVCRLYRREYIVKNGLRQTKQRTGEDALFIFETYKHPFSRIVYNPKVYYIYMRKEGTANTKYDPMRFEFELAVSEGFESAVRSLGFKDGRYDTLIYRKYVTGFSIAVANLAKAPISVKEKCAVIENKMACGKNREAFRKLPLKSIPAGSTRLKVLLLRLKLYHTTVWLGELKKRTENKSK